MSELFWTATITSTTSARQRDEAVAQLLEVGSPGLVDEVLASLDTDTAAAVAASIARADRGARAAEALLLALAAAEASSGGVPARQAAHEARQAVPGACASPFSGRSFTYGEVSHGSLVVVMDSLAALRCPGLSGRGGGGGGTSTTTADEALLGCTFVDLGSGVGNVVLGAALAYPTLAAVVGIELVGALHERAEAARGALAELDDRLTAASGGVAGGGHGGSGYHEECAGAAGRVALYCADFQSAEGEALWGDADIVMCHATCFDDALLAHLAAAAARLLKPGALMCTTSRDLVDFIDGGSEACPDAGATGDCGLERIEVLKLEFPFHICRKRGGETCTTHQKSRPLPTAPLPTAPPPVRVGKEADAAGVCELLSHKRPWQLPGTSSPGSDFYDLD